MQIQMTGRGLSVNESLRTYARNGLERAVRLVKNSLVDSNIVLTREKNRVHAEVHVRVKGHTFQAEANTTSDATLALDEAFDKIESQVRRYKDRLKGRGRNGVRAVREHVFDLDRNERDEPRIIRTSAFEVKPMSADEALLQLQASNDDFLVFRNAVTDRVNVLYARRDGNFGLIEPEV